MKKWLGYGALVLLVIGIGLYIAFRVFVGAVNTPVGDYSFDAEAMTDRVRVPEGFSIGVFAANVPNARVIRFTNAGDLLVANPNKDQIVLLERDKDGDGQADGQRILIQELNGPNGLDFFGDYLYVAETDAIGRVLFDHELGVLTGEYERIVVGLPGGGNHWKKTLRFGPDGLMYVSMGSSCNVCIEEDPRRAAMVTYNPDGGGEKIFALGLRNSAGFDWSPLDGAIYATDNGRDLLGDDYPACELNKVVADAHYGWPYANGAGDSDPDFGEERPDIVASAVPMEHGFAAHNAPLGIEFVRNTIFPAEYQNAAVVALHGSWNRSSKDGYKVVTLHWDDEGNVTEKDFVTGFLKDDHVIGRPAEVTEGPDGAFYIADDYAGVIYRVAYGESQASLMPMVGAPVYNRDDTLSAYSDEERQVLAAEGQALFQRFSCRTCHMPDMASLKELQDLGSRYDVAGLKQFLTRPRAPMPVYPLDDRQKEALAVHLLESY